MGFRNRQAPRPLDVSDNLPAVDPTLEVPTMRRPLTTILIAGTAATALLTGCGSSSTGAPTGTAASGATASASSTLSGELTVLAAASLTGTFTELGRTFEAAHPGTRITFSFGASSTLATQITSGAPADVFASASAKPMATVVEAKAATDPQVFARNAMELVVPPANPAAITGLADLAKPGVKLVLCAEAVPCGTVARKVLTNAKLTVTPVSAEADVKATLTKVELGEADAGIVYVTDVLAAGSKVKGIAIPADVNAATDYPVAALTGSKNPALAKAFVDYILSAEATTTLTRAGFQKP